MFETLAAALERIQFQAKSPLFKDLTELFTKTQNDIEATRELLIDIRGHYDVNKLQKYITKTSSFITDLIEIIKKDVNITIHSVEIVPRMIINAAVYPGFNLITSEMDRITRTPKEGDAEKIVDVFALMDQNLDLNTSKVRDDLSKHTDFRLFLNVGMIINEKTPIQPEEAAAIVIHEIGHCYSYMEYLANVFVKTDHLRAVIARFGDILTTEDVSALRTAILKESARSHDPYFKQNILAVINILDQRKITTKAQAQCFYLTALSCIFYAGTTYGADVFTALTRSDDERFADEFVSQHGAGPALTTMFIKEDKPPFTVGQNVTSLQKLIITFRLIFHNSTRYLPSTGGGTYDLLIRRLTLAIQNAVVNLNDPELSKETRDEIIALVKAGREALNDHTALAFVKKREETLILMAKLSKPFRTKLFFTDASLDTDYQKLQELTKDLLLSPFAYHSARLQSLIDET